nr:hypothetical protein L203_01245 [Cryptococcus depauperatus CBS 7841]
MAIFDELQLINASSVALTRDVLSWYWRLGGVIVTCFNHILEDLHLHGVHRERLADFLDSLKARCEVLHVDEGRSWRRGVNNHREATDRRSYRSWRDLLFHILSIVRRGAFKIPCRPHVRNEVVLGLGLGVLGTSGVSRSIYLK